MMKSHRHNNRSDASPRHRRLLLSIHDVGPRFNDQVDRLRDFLGQTASSSQMALLVVPNHWGEAPIRPGSPFATRLRAWADSGAEIFVHGWYHRDNTPHRGAYTRLKARHLTASEGEFLGLSQEEAGTRMAAGKALLEDICGRSVSGFIAPAWLYGNGARTALAENGFALAEDHWRIWHPPSGATLAHSPVLTWASRSRTRILSSLFAARVLPSVLRHAPVARLAVHPGDTAVPAIMRSIEHALTALLRYRGIGRYDSLLSQASPSCVS